jgi:hypothetical protein
MAIDPNAYLNKKHTGWFTGKEGNKGYAYWNPETESYVRQTEADYNQQAREHRDTQGGRLTQSYINKFGDSVFGLKPTDTHKGVINGEEVNYAGKNPYAGMWTTPDTGTPVPGSPVRNPDFVMPDSRFQEDTRGPQISYGQHGRTPKEQEVVRQSIWNQAFANNPELAQSPEFAQALENSGLLSDLAPQAPQGPAYIGGIGYQHEYDNPDFVLGDTTYTQEDLLAMSNEEAFNLMNTHGEYFHANKDNPDKDDTNQQGRAMATPGFLQKITDHVEDTHSGVQQFLNAARGLQYHNPEAFEEWELKNPEMALRYHARAAAGNGNVGGIKGYDHAGRAQALSYGISQQLGYGEDGKQDGKAIAYNFDTFNDLQSENGDGDFWKLGTPNTFTNDLGDYIEDNPLEVAAMVASVAIPWAAPAVAGGLSTLLGTNVSSAMATGILNAGLSAVGGADLDEALLSGLKAYGFADLGGRITDGLKDIVGALDPKVLEMMESAQAGIEQGVTAGDILQGGWELGNLGADLANEANDYGNNSDPTIISEHVQGNVTPPTPEDNSGGGGGGSQSGSGGPAAPTGGNSEGGGTGAQDGSGDTPWVYEGEGVFRNENTGATRTETEYEGAVVGDNYGFGDDPLDNNPTPPTPNDSLPNGYEWVMTQGTWTLNGPNGETISQQELAEQIYGSLVTGTGTTGGNGGGLPGGGDLGTGIDNTIGTGGGSGTGGGTGTGSGGGDGDGEGEGEGDGEGSGTPLADGLMRSLGQGTNVPTGLVDIPQVAPIQTRPLDWSFLRKVSEGRG